VKKHLNPSTVIACIALFVALAGTAFAAGLGRNAVRTRNIANNAVTTPKLRNNAVNAVKLRNGAVTGPKIANEAVGTAKLAPAAVRSGNLGGGVVTTNKLKDLGVTEAKLGNNSVSNLKLAAGSVETGKLADEAVTGDKVSAALLAQLVKNVSYETNATATDKEAGSKEIIATCPAGKVAIAGGARVTGAEAEGIRLVESFATDAGVDGKRTGWRARAESSAIVPQPWGVEALAVCAEL
jgi:hypothetical protein